MNIVFIIPTGLGCAIGGDCGDATPAVRLLSPICDKIILHPNVVNACDINEMPANALYVEGSILDRFLEGNIGLDEVRNNRLLIVTNKPAPPELINSVSAARVTLGLRAEVLELTEPLKMIVGFNEDGSAGGKVMGVESLIEDVNIYYDDFDALGLATPIDLPTEVALKYFREGGVNPYGAVEAMASRLIAEAIDKPVAHAPIEDDPELNKFKEVVTPGIAPEVVSVSYIHCLLKGLHKAPRIGEQIQNTDIDYLISPIGCWGRPHEAARKAGIPIIFIRENATIYGETFPIKSDAKIHIIRDYLSLPGYLLAQQEGISLESLRPDLHKTNVLKLEEEEDEK